MGQYEREEDAICNDETLSEPERRRLLRELERDYRDAAHEAAREAYDRELENWR